MDLSTPLSTTDVSHSEPSRFHTKFSLPHERILRVDENGLYCPRGGFYIDPAQPVDLGLITHAHGDHARWGSKKYLCSEDSLAILKQRLGPESQIEGVPYGKQLTIGETKVSFHPAGHILGSAQIRVECDGQVWVASGDYKRAHDPSCAPFEVVPCDVFITEATFGLPIYRWEPGAHTAKEILQWWDRNIKEGRPSLLFCYALGKTQRMLAEIKNLDPNRQAYVHGAMTDLTEHYRKAGVEMIDTLPVSETSKGKSFNGELILAPPSAYRSLWMKRFKGADTGFASGWMRVRGARRRKGYDRGFVLSDHADWHELLTTIRETGAKFVYPTHGYTDSLTRYLLSQGIDAAPLEVTAYEGEGSGD